MRQRLTYPSGNLSKTFAGCPRCWMLAGTLTLLTTTLAYYVCTRCHHSWHDTRMSATSGATGAAS